MRRSRRVELPVDSLDEKTLTGLGVLVPFTYRVSKFLFTAYTVGAIVRPNLLRHASSACESDKCINERICFQGV
jgi:hypothetical protein